MVNASDRAWLKQQNEQILRDWELDIALEDVVRMQAAEADVVIKRNPAIAEAAQRAISQGIELLKPVVLFKVKQVEQFRHMRFMLMGGGELSAELLAQHLIGAEYIVAAICTIGEGVERLAKQHFLQDPTFGLALEGFGSAAVETLATEFCARIDRLAEGSGMSTSIPLCPGMVGWPVEQGQGQIFNLLDSSRIGVELTGSCMMLPVKTISLVLGVGAHINAQGSTCDYCSMRDRCHYRDHYLHVEKS
jgi:cobalamin-dependent methionine synthase I